MLRRNGWVSHMPHGLMSSDWLGPGWKVPQKHSLFLLSSWLAPLRVTGGQRSVWLAWFLFSPLVHFGWCWAPCSLEKVLSYVPWPCICVPSIPQPGLGGVCITVTHLDFSILFLSSGLLKKKKKKKKTFVGRCKVHSSLQQVSLLCSFIDFWGSSGALFKIP